MEKPLVSVIIPVFNGASFITEAIKSVWAQKYEPLEIIVVDDGSTDGTAEIVKTVKGNIRYFHQKKSGVAAARNKGIQHAKGELIAFIDADDIWEDNKLSLQSDLLHQNPAADIIYGFLLVTQMIPTDELKQINLENEKGLFATQLGSLLVRRTVFDKVGGFDEEMTVAEDLDWINRVREAGIHILAHKDIVQFYRMHQNSITKDKSLTNSYILKAYKKSLDRRRTSGNKSVLPFPKPENMDDIFKYWQNKKVNDE